MDVFKEDRIIFQNLPKNMINDLYKLCFSKLLCIVNKSSYEKEQLKLHQSLLGVKGGGGAKTALRTALSPKFSCNAKHQYL